MYLDLSHSKVLVGKAERQLLQAHILTTHNEHAKYNTTVVSKYTHNTQTELTG